MLSVRRVEAERTWALRQRILRPQQTVAEMNFPGDFDETTAHFGGFVGEELLGVASVYLKANAMFEAARRQWQLRGMATADAGRGCGLGGLILDACLSHARDSGGGLLWCNARTPVLGFYERYGLRVVSEEFTPPGLGPHRVMVVDLDAPGV
ncbi:MAG: GNAT family N-acetyltransferase [Tepidisphaera sp.]|nr:GNAT family N-acetyltransferase [Tepidisphaera sp.]